LRALCVGRHPFLGDHLARFFEKFGLETAYAVGIEGAIAVARRVRPDLVICDYDLLATLPLDAWENDALLSRTPVVAVSMTRRPDEAHLLDVNGIGGFLYLPTLRREDALVVLGGAAAPGRYGRAPLGWQQPFRPAVLDTLPG
jgi:DNA-binding NarL/FixJ family response regulator